jgi:hypothetical protein
MSELFYSLLIEKGGLPFTFPVLGSRYLVVLHQCSMVLFEKTRVRTFSRIIGTGTTQTRPILIIKFLLFFEKIKLERKSTIYLCVDRFHYLSLQLNILRCASTFYTIWN